MAEVELPSHVKEAISHREQYYNRRDFIDARKFVLEFLKVGAGETLDKKVNGFLRGRRIAPDEEPEDLTKRKQDDVELLGSTFYFARKFFTTSHDIGEGINPTPLVEIVFEAIQASDNIHATKFLSELGGVCSKHSYPQEQVIAVVRDVLPGLNQEYSATLSTLESRHPKNTTQYNAEKAQIDKRQMSLLDRVVPYMEHVIMTHQAPSIDGFRKYAGLGNAKGDDKKMSMDDEYIIKVLKEERDRLETEKRERKRKDYLSDELYKVVITRIEKEVGALVMVEYGGQRGSGYGTIDLCVGDITNPKRHSLTYGKHTLQGDKLNLFLAICDFVIEKPEIFPHYRIKTGKAKIAINEHLGRGYR